MTGFELAEVGHLGQPVDPLGGGDVDPLTGRLLSVAEIRDIVAHRDLIHTTMPGAAPDVIGGSVSRLGAARRVRRTTARVHADSAGPGPAAAAPLLASPATEATVGVTPPAGVWVMGVSGGCGESTAAAILPGATAGQRRWPPAAAGGDVPVLLVARGSMASLAAAQRVAGEWAVGGAPEVRLLGLLVVADAPGGEPRPVTDLIRLLGGGLPQVWRLPWVRDWRLASPQDGPLPRPAAAVVRAITDLYR